MAARQYRTALFAKKSLIEKYLKHFLERVSPFDTRGGDNLTIIRERSPKRWLR